MSAYFGYIDKIIDNKHILIVDEEVRHVVELIYSSYISGLGFESICTLLNSHEYATPSERLSYLAFTKRNIYKRQITTIWQRRTVKKILLNPIYTGKLPPNNYTKSIRCNVEYEAIISKKDFQTVQDIHNNKLEGQRDYYDYIFRSYVRCDYGHFCRGVNIFLKYSRRREYNCSEYLKFGNAECDNHAIPESDLLQQFKQYLTRTTMKYRYILDNINPNEIETIDKLRYILAMFNQILMAKVPDKKILAAVLNKIILNKIRNIEVILNDDFIVGVNGVIENLFKGLIYCKSCGKKFGFKREGNAFNYICSGYNNYGKDFCVRNVVKQSDLEHLVNLHFGINFSTKSIVEDNVIRIEVDKDLITIFYLDGGISKWNNNELKV
ncbi:recombinase family protein [Clostridium estertheticum]|uniref:recombinase family protein n=1 Tax=Clostridium estertheticum TaxID=238834 RepID=UPI001C0B6629|nr:recombinase family protein [Clostridium estertheticum]MBU3186675.1 recombinase family protein [Clostridium estertheticum]